MKAIYVAAVALLALACYALAAPHHEGHSHGPGGHGPEHRHGPEHDARKREFMSKICNDDFMTDERMQQLEQCNSDQDGSQMFEDCTKEVYGEYENKQEMRRKICERKGLMMRVHRCIRNKVEEAGLQDNEEFHQKRKENKECMYRVLEIQAPTTPAPNDAENEAGEE